MTYLESIKFSLLKVYVLFHNPSPIRLLSSGNKVFVDIDNGLFEGETPLLVELTPGSTHFVTFRAVDESAQYKCEFRIDRAPQAGAPSTLVITPAASGQKARCQIKN